MVFLRGQSRILLRRHLSDFGRRPETSSDPSAAPLNEVGILEQSLFSVPSKRRWLGPASPSLLSTAEINQVAGISFSSQTMCYGCGALLGVDDQLLETTNDRFLTRVPLTDYVLQQITGQANFARVH